MAAAAPSGLDAPAGQAAGEVKPEAEVAMDLRCSADLEAEVAAMLSGMNQSVKEGPAATQRAGAAGCLGRAWCMWRAVLFHCMGREWGCSQHFIGLGLRPPIAASRAAGTWPPSTDRAHASPAAPSGSGVASGEGQPSAGPPPEGVPVLPDWVRNRGEREAWRRGRVGVLEAGVWPFLFCCKPLVLLARVASCTCLEQRTANLNRLLLPPLLRCEDCATESPWANKLPPACLGQHSTAVTRCPLFFRCPQTAGRICPWSATLWTATRTSPHTCARSLLLGSQSCSLGSCLPLC